MYKRTQLICIKNYIIEMDFKTYNENDFCRVV